MQLYFMNSVPAGIAAPSVIESTLSEAKPRLIKDDIRFPSGLSSNWRQPSDNFDNVDYLLKMLPYAGGM